MNKYITEFIGTFFLCLVVALNANAGVANLLAIGSILMVMVYAGGHISGAHYNPAVTLAVMIRGRIGLSDAVMYWFAQILAGAAAAIIASSIFSSSGSGVGAVSDAGTVAALLAEILGTFALAYVILNVATSKKTAGNSYFGLAIGFTVLACGYIFGKYSGGAFNPAVAISQSIAQFFSWADIWIYLLGCLGGGALAAVVFNFLNPDDK